MIKTVCAKCKFAEFNDNQQTGCHFDRINKFKEIGVNVEFVTKDGVTFNIIDDLCNYCFDKESYNQTPNADSRFKEMTQLSLDWIVVDNKKTDYLSTYNNLILSIHRAIYQDIRPKNFFYITAANPNTTAEQKYLLSAIVDDMLRGTDINPFSTVILDETSNIEDCTKMILHKVSSRYYTIFESGYNIPSDFNYKINKAYNEELRFFTLFDGIEGINGVTIHTNSIAQVDNSIDKLRNSVVKTYTDNLSRYYIKSGEIF